MRWLLRLYEKPLPLMEVELLIRSDAAYRILEGGYPNVRITKRRPDGSLEALLTVYAPGDDFPIELLSWVQS
ncbi:hypothetical protein [Meiothermus sp.]|jgi:hypothetical protein|uniref:hypothetical protein n=1 Tax=Meiothermus sp. TaxID=1955249 RepID=UPI0021DCAD86|nr:hypothetical protein [Meiothermus sp.]GIW26179.1 MAG: hypothetical protein KatS3mg069_2446 [Meiothermus sp.]